MINLDQIKNYFPPQISGEDRFRKLMLKEYLLLMILDYLSTTNFIKKITFIGGTYLRLAKGIENQT